MYAIINCTSHCNMGCKYCFEENWKENNISIQSINETFKRSMDNFIKFVIDLREGNENDMIFVLLHGGEPLLIKTELLVSFFDAITKNRKNIKIIMQSNGSIINDEIIDMIKKYDIGIGISIDGDRKSHDKFRVTKDNRGTFDLIDRNIQKLKKENINVGCMVTFTKENLNNVTDVYQYFADRNLDFSFNPFFVPSNSESYSDIKFDIELYKKSICKLFDMWIMDENSTITIRNFERIIDGLTNQEHQQHVCSFMRDCSEEFCAIDVNGYLYTCNHFCNDSSKSFANINDVNAYECMKKQHSYSDRTNYLKDNDCNGCTAFDLCNGGCPYHSMVQYGTIMKKDPLCQCYKSVIHYIYNYIKNEMS